MEQNPNRLYFIDAMRAWAILMMLQGHFIDGLLDPVYKDSSNLAFRIWEYFRGITAPVFFTVSGFIFTYLLVRVPQKGYDNPRVKKGVTRGLQLLFIGYLLRLNLFGLLHWEIYPSFYLVDVLQCIGLSILGIIGAYLLTVHRKSWVLPALLLGITLFLFFLEPAYKQWSYPLLPDLVENYFTKVNGSVFTIFPWFGYSTFGAFLSLFFIRYRNAKLLYPAAIGIAMVTGVALIFSTPLFALVAEKTGMGLFKLLTNNNYLFIRMGNVMVIFAIFMMFRRLLKNATMLRLGQNTLSIYVIHFMILYGSLTGFGLYYYLNSSLSPYIAIPGALMFMVLCSRLALRYDTHEEAIKSKIGELALMVRNQTEPYLNLAQRQIKSASERLLRILGLVKTR